MAGEWELGEGGQGAELKREASHWRLGSGSTVSPTHVMITWEASKMVLACGPPSLSMDAGILDKW